MFTFVSEFNSTMTLTIAQTDTIVNSLEDGLQLINQAADTFDIDLITQNLKVFNTVGMFFGAASIILNLVQAFLPDRKHVAIMREFALLNNKFESVRNDISDLDNSLRWDNRAIRLSEITS